MSGSSSLFQHYHPCSQTQKSVSVNDYPIGSRIRDYWWQWKWRRRCQAKDHELIGEKEISREWDVDQSVITDYPRHSFDPEFPNTCGYKRPSVNYPLLALCADTKATWKLFNQTLKEIANTGQEKEIIRTKVKLMAALSEVGSLIWITFTWGGLPVLAVRESGAIKNFRKLDMSSQDFPTLKNCHNCSLSVSENSSKKKSCKYTIDLDVGIGKWIGRGAK